MLTDDMTRRLKDDSQDGNVQLILSGNMKKRSIITVDGVQDVKDEVIRLSTPEDKVKRSKKFRAEWMEEVHFKDWLKPHASDETYCICIACDIKLRCGKSELEKHASGLKHTRRMEAMVAQLSSKGKEPSDPLCEETSKLEARPTVQEAHVYCSEDGSSYLVACDESVEERNTRNANENYTAVPENTLSGALLKVLELLEGKTNFVQKKQEMAEIEHKFRMQILHKELQLKSLEVQIKEAELQKLKCDGINVSNRVKLN